ncbi:MAG: type II toxin-antitoxin system VapC family toxin [Candidatus Acidiferrales bacterium]
MILVDTGPLVALVHEDDQHHASCVAAFKEIRGPIGTVWPVLSEAMHLVAHLPASQEAVWEMLELHSVHLWPLNSVDIPRIRELMRKYADLPMDLADAALVAVAEREDIRTIFTVDKKDFALYRLRGRLRFTVVP